MTELSPDRELVTDYVAKGSESAFRALVNRYLGLVYGTALRQVGDRGAAEEITQNVFMALARKAPRLHGMETLGGWLHRTTILESRARSRADLRRIQREGTAAELARVEAEGASLLDPVEPLLDEALLRLREPDRMALMLRFWDDRPLKEVGAALGVDEDAARKRVSRALDQITKFFTERGFQIGAAGCATALATSAPGAVPTGLATTVLNASLTAGASTSPLAVLGLKLMTLTKTQTAVACALVVAVPLAVQHRAEARLDRDLAAVQKKLREAEQNALTVEEQAGNLRANLATVAQQGVTAETRLQTLAQQRERLPQVKEYRWDDNAPMVRLPKALLKGLGVVAVMDRNATLSPEIKEVLQFTPAEAERAQAALHRFLSSYNTARAQTMRRVEPTEKELRGRSPEDVRVFDLPAVPYKEMRDELFAEITDAIGSDREAVLREYLQRWMPTDDNSGMNTGWSVLNFPYRLRLHRPAENDPRIRWEIQADTPTRGSMSASFSVDAIPDFYRPHIQDWISLAQANALKKQ
jgi:RNA polymerase sigma factor (sigma-70 family)